MNAMSNHHVDVEVYLKIGDGHENIRIGAGVK